LTHEKEDSHDYSQPKNFLFHLAYNFMGHLVDILPQSTKIYRARRRKENQKFNHEDLTSPPPSLSQNSRMSPVGISFFYGGMDPEVCIHEVRPDVTETIEIAEFKVKKDLFVLELSHDFGEPRSIFDPYYDFSYEEFFKPFLQHFIHDISKPIRKIDNEVEYIPTQIFTEFIKSINFTNSFYSGEDEGNLQDVFINGIKFKSSIMNDGVNLVLFKGPEISNTYNSDLNDAWLYYKGSKTYQVNEIIVKSSATSIR